MYSTSLFSTSLSLPGAGAGTTSNRWGGQGSGLVGWVAGLGICLPAALQVSGRAPLPLAKTWSSCRSAPTCGRAANQKQTDRPRDFVPAHPPLALLEVAGVRGSRSSLPGAGSWALWEALALTALSQLRSPGERGSGRPSGLSGRRSHGWEQVVLGLTPRLTAKLLLFPLSGPVLPTA